MLDMWHVMLSTVLPRPTEEITPKAEKDRNIHAFMPSHPLSRELSQRESLLFARPESSSVFLDEHCFHGHKSKAPHGGGAGIAYFAY